MEPSGSLANLTAAAAAAGAAEDGNFSLENDNSTLSNYQHHHPATVVVLCSIYGIISLTAFVGNALVIWIICTGRRMRTVINMYIGNLAMADVIIAVVCIPFQFQAALLQRWDLPSFMCKLCPFVQHLSINASIMTLVVIALDRYRGIMHPLKGPYTKVRARINIAAIWVVGTIVAVPNLLVFHFEWYNFAMVMVQYVIPLCIITATYGKMSMGLWGMKTPGQSNEARDENIQANKRRVTKMLFIVVLMFGICWLPFQIFNLLSSLNFPLNFPGINYIWMASHILAMSNSSCNPLIYGIYNEKFRHEFRRKLVANCSGPDTNHTQFEFDMGNTLSNVGNNHNSAPLQLQARCKQLLYRHNRSATIAGVRRQQQQQQHPHLLRNLSHQPQQQQQQQQQQHRLQPQQPQRTQSLRIGMVTSAQVENSSSGSNNNPESEVIDRGGRSKNEGNGKKANREESSPRQKAKPQQQSNGHLMHGQEDEKEGKEAERRS